MGRYRKQSRNVNRHTDQGTRLLDESVKRDGWIGAITTAADGETFDGSNRIEIGRDAFENAIEVHTDGSQPVVVVRDDIPTADDPKAKRLGVVANAVTSLDWNPDAALLKAIAEDDPAIRALAQEDAKLRELLKGEVVVEEKESPEQLLDRAEEIQQKWNVQTGDIFEGEGVRLMCGNATEDFYKLAQGVKPNLLLTDPPYGINVVKVGNGSSADSGGAKPVTIGAVLAPHPYAFRGKKATATDGGRGAVDATPYRPVRGDDRPFDPVPLLGLAEDAIIFGGNYFASKLPDSRCWIVWDKNNTGNFADAEIAWTSFDKGVRLYHWTWNGLVREGNRKIEGVKRFHPTQKPAGLMAEIIKDFTREGDAIADLYMGSGSVIVACVLTRRLCFGMDIDPAYVAVSLERLSLLGLTCERVESN